MILSEVDSPVDQVECDLTSVTDDEDLFDPEEENLSDTDPEDEWETAAV